jgi:hypothetical protein
VEIVRSLVVTLVLLAGVSAHAQGVSVLFKTTPAGGAFAPRNVVAVWIADSNGVFVKTIGRWADTRKSDLVAWNQASGGDADAISGATRLDHSIQLAAQWDLKSRAGVVMPDGTYTIHIELSDSQTTTTAPNHEGTYTFVKGPTPQVQTPADANGFTGVKITYATTAGCDNGIVDPGEKCDPIASCPTACPDTGDACQPQILLGDPATCSSSCLAEMITTCKGGDRCCPMGCDATTDSDCGAGGGSGGDNGSVSGGCATDGASRGAFASLMVGLVAALALFRRRT